MNRLMNKEEDKKRLNKRIVSLVLLILLVSASTLFAGELAGELSLEEAIAYGLENNSGLRTAYEELQRQERNLREAIQLKWQVGLEANYGWNFQQARDLDLSGADKGDYSVSISAGKNFFRFNSNRIQINE